MGNRVDLNLLTTQATLQIQQLNLAFANTGFQFYHAHTAFLRNAGEVNIDDVDNSTTKILPMYDEMVNPEGQLKVAVVDFNGTWSGVTPYMPWYRSGWWRPLNPKYRTVWVDYQTLPQVFAPIPSNNLFNRNKGGTLVHEIGHFFGLFHTFQGNQCGSFVRGLYIEPKGDEINDTPIHLQNQEPNQTLREEPPNGFNTCPDPKNQPDPIHNYMNYVSDNYYTEFTLLQIDRMQRIVQKYYPHYQNYVVTYPNPFIYSNLFSKNEQGKTEENAPKQLAIENFPNPFSGITTLKYQIAQKGDVSLIIFDILGREVQTLVSEFKTTGFHEIDFQATSLPLGVYFYRLAQNGQTLTGKMILQ